MKPPEIRRRLRESGRTQESLARHLGISKDSASRLVAGHRNMRLEELDKIQDFFGDTEPRHPEFVQIPVYGYVAAGGTDRIALASDHVLERIEVPYGLTRGETIAIRVAGDSMEPRLYSGELVIVELGVPPNRGGDCVVEMKDGTALVKQYQGIRDGYAFLRQLNPDQEVRLPLTQVKAIHAVKYRR